MTMKTFALAVEDDVLDAEREEKIAALIEQGKTRKEAEEEVDPYVEFKVGERTIRAYRPIEGQVIFMLAALGKGQSKESRLSSILNILFESMREDDKDWLEARLLTRDPNQRIGMKTIEGIFEHCVEGWFGRPTPPPSDSAE